MTGKQSNHKKTYLMPQNNKQVSTKEQLMISNINGQE